MRTVVVSRNFGHYAAASAGIEHALGDAVVLIDAYFQDPPEAINQIAARWRDSADVVYEHRARKDGETIFKVWSARPFYSSLKHISDVAIPLDTGDFHLSWQGRRGSA